jgi:hypothetical protein
MLARDTVGKKPRQKNSNLFFEKSLFWKCACSLRAHVQKQFSRALTEGDTYPAGALFRRGGLLKRSPFVTRLMSALGH